MPCKRLQPSYRPSANSLTLVPTGTTEYIAAGDSQASVPFPMEIGRDFDLQWKTASGLSYLLLQLAVTAGKRAFPEKGATEATSCPKGGNMWRYWYGLTQGWGSTTYDWALRQILPRCREEVLPAEPDRELCQREDTGLPRGTPYLGRIHIWDYPEGNQAIRTPSPVQGLTGDPGELTPVLGLASDCSAQSDCRGCLEDSPRVHRPGNWTGGEKRRSYPRVRENGTASMTPASSSRPLLTQHTGRNAEIVESFEGVRCLPACSSADVCQRGAVRQRMGGGNTPGGVSPHPQGARLALRLVRQGDGLHYPVGQSLFGDSLPFLLPSVADKELITCGLSRAQRLPARCM